MRGERQTASCASVRTACVSHVCHGDDGRGTPENVALIDMSPHLRHPVFSTGYPFPAEYSCARSRMAPVPRSAA